jgi:hypothetical protein
MPPPRALGQPRRPPAMSLPAITVAMEQLRHICEVCGLEQVPTPEAAFDAGWHHPPRMGMFGVISPRTCPNCLIKHTIWWALAMDHYTPDMLSPGQRATVDRILGEPSSIAVP